MQEAKIHGNWNASEGMQRRLLWWRGEVAQGCRRGEGRDDGGRGRGGGDDDAGVLASLLFGPPTCPPSENRLWTGSARDFLTCSFRLISGR
jgi:hypothetical protein